MQVHLTSRIEIDIQKIHVVNNLFATSLIDGVIDFECVFENLNTKWSISNNNGLIFVWNSTLKTLCILAPSRKWSNSFKQKAK